MSASPVEEIAERMSRLPADRQAKLLAYARSLDRVGTRGTPARRLLKHVGVIDPDDGKRMLEAIEEGCEQIDPAGW